MILVIASFTLPLMAIYVLEQIFSGKAETQNWKKALGLLGVLITAGLSLVLPLYPVSQGRLLQLVIRVCPNGCTRVWPAIANSCLGATLSARPFSSC